MKESGYDKNFKWKPLFWLLFIFSGVTIIMMSSQISTLNQDKADLTNRLNYFSSTSRAELQKCISDAQGLNVLDPTLYNGNSLQAATAACQARYPVN